MKSFLYLILYLNLFIIAITCYKFRVKPYVLVCIYSFYLIFAPVFGSQESADGDIFPKTSFANVGDQWNILKLCRLVMVLLMPPDRIARIHFFANLGHGSRLSLKKVHIKIWCNVSNLIEFRFLYIYDTPMISFLLIKILPISLNKIRLVGKALRRRCFSWFLFKRVWWNDDRRILRFRSFDAGCCWRLWTSFRSSSPTSDPVNWTIFGFWCSCVFSFASPLGP